VQHAGRQAGEEQGCVHVCSQVCVSWAQVLARPQLGWDRIRWITLLYPKECNPLVIPVWTEARVRYLAAPATMKKQLQGVVTPPCCH
jgi:hypothetical protein